MGVTGVALPTLLARMAAALFMVYSLQRFGKEIRIHAFSQLKPDREIVRKILSIGIPNSVESGLFNFGKILLQSLVSTLGTASIAAYAVASNLATYLYLPGNALGAGMITVVGQCYGAKKPEQGGPVLRSKETGTGQVLRKDSFIPELCVPCHNLFRINHRQKFLGRLL